MVINIIRNFILYFLLLIIFSRCVNEERNSLSVYCGAASKPALEKSAELFSKKYDIEVYLQFSGSGTISLIAMNSVDVIIGWRVFSQYIKCCKTKFNHSNNIVSYSSSCETYMVKSNRRIRGYGHACWSSE